MREAVDGPGVRAAATHGVRATLGTAVGTAVGTALAGVRTGARTVLSPAGLWGAALEMAWVSAHVATYPLGLVRDSLPADGSRVGLDGLGPVKRGLLIGDVEAAGTPILLVHGIVDNHSVFTVLRRGLRRRGFGRVTSVNYSWLTGDVRQLAARLAEQVEQLCDDTGYERVHIVGHSLGGLIARYYVQRMGGDARVHTLVTLGTPHRGSFLARTVPHPLVRQLRPGSDLYAELDAPAPGIRTRFLNFWSDLDQVVVPQRNARLSHPDLSSRSVMVRGVGHLSLPIHGQVVHEICTALAHLDHHGGTVTRGVTTLVGAGRPEPEPVGGLSAGAAAPPASRGPRRARRAARRGSSPPH